ncbi:glycosyltransferase family 87 protein [Candidatus Nitronereus thalassa]|uniref:Glycosyltransferase family 87 protein n=1 Tax=Candidatus Nitronereus thalassa TaxID=3020898 RepID=A0ABU3K3K6_9BACT|nr:glycosyltransferase family 87 protein [Candidatus Nitronereus thalassa]MDT7040992.1 glycosyltransferase family 87 protein [Candidatus Nitronereus thalassa]
MDKIKIPSMNIRSIIQRPTFNGISLPCFVFLATLIIGWNVLLTYLMIDKLNMNDFGKFFYSIVAYLQGGEMYGPNPGTFIVINPQFGQQFWNLNPPHFHLPLLPLGHMAPEIALTIWGILNLIGLVASLHFIGKELHMTPTPRQSRVLFIGFLAFCGTGAFFLTGQLSFLLLFPITISWIQARNTQWAKAGLSLGLACAIKPFLLIFAPYFLIKKEYKAFANLLFICIVSYITGILVLGQEIYWQWIEKLRLVDWSWASMNASLHGLLSRIFQENPSFALAFDSSNTVNFLWLALSGLIATSTFFIIYKDQSKYSVDRAFALLLISAILISPLGWIYYLFFPLGPLTAIIYQRGKTLQGTPLPAITYQVEARNGLVAFAAVGFILPLQFTVLFQPAAWATITIGSIYCWCTLAVWATLLLDWHIETSTQTEPNYPEQKEFNSLSGSIPEMGLLSSILHRNSKQLDCQEAGSIERNAI